VARDVLIDPLQRMIIFRKDVKESHHRIMKGQMFLYFFLPSVKKSSDTYMSFRSIRKPKMSVYPPEEKNKTKKYL